MEKIKSYIRQNEADIFTIILVITVGFLGFGLGKLSQMSLEKEPVEILLPEPLTQVSNVGLNAVTEPSVTSNKGQYVASKNSNKYHLPSCSGAKRISEANKIWFASKQEAESRGYTPAGNCPGI